MNDTLQKVEKFFEDDLKIKKILHEVVPNEIKDSYDAISRTEYSNKLYQAIQDIEYYLLDIIKLNLFSLSKEDVIKIKLQIHQTKKALDNCGDDFKKMKQIYQQYISEMSENFIDLVGKKSVGYSLSNSISATLPKASTINEILHCFHQDLTNNENLYNKMPKLSEKQNLYGYPIKLYGKENNLAIDIYNKFPIDLDCGDVDILSLNNSQKILLMIRDRGHALSIEINFMTDKCLINYFIPKICNADMVNQLPGVHKVTNDSPFTTGIFESDSEHLATNLIHLIENVPMDEDMYKKGGIFESDTNLIHLIENVSMDEEMYKKGEKFTK